MKNILSFSLALACSVAAVRGQTKKYRYSSNQQADAGKANFGPQVGIGMSKLIAQGASTHSIPSFHVGLFGEYAFTDLVGLKLTALYSVQGGEGEGRIGNSNVNAKDRVNLNYILGSALFSFYLWESRQDCLFAGPYIGYAVSGKYCFYVNSQRVIELDLKEETTASRNVDFGLTLGYGHEFDVGLILGIMLKVGLRSIWEDLTRRNSVSQFSLGYNFAKLIQ